eukprot:gene43057-17878_t
MSSVRARIPPPLRVSASLPPLRQMLRDGIVSVLLSEVGFYYSHRLLHHPA